MTKTNLSDFFRKEKPDSLEEDLESIPEFV